jgi:hypothetical protein
LPLDGFRGLLVEVVMTTTVNRPPWYIKPSSTSAQMIAAVVHQTAINWYMVTPPSTSVRSTPSVPSIPISGVLLQVV